MKVVLGGVLALSLLAGCTHLPARKPASSNAASYPLRAELPQASALGPWHDVPGYRTSDVDVFSLPSKKIECGDPNLYPTHPQQSTKLYHSYQTAAYDQTRLRAEDEACKIGSKYENTLGWRPCLLADIAEDAVISDTYQDACGHFYRAAWEVTFLKSDDNMGLLFSRGRTLYPKENAEFENDMYVAQTYPVAAEDFLVITDLFPGDLEKIEAQKKAAEATHSYDPAKGIFIPKKVYK